MPLGLQTRLVAIACAVLVIGLVAVDFINPSLPYIMQDLGASQRALKDLSVLYLLGLGGAQFFYGSFSDRHGRRPALLLGLAIAIIGLCVTGISGSVHVLYVGRVITACGAASCTVISRAIIVDCVPDRIGLQRAFGWFTIAGQMSPAVAPLLGAGVQALWGWRTSFFMLAALTLAMALMACWRLPETTVPQRGRRAIASYRALLRDQGFVVHSVGSALICSLTLGFYAMAPYAFFALGYGTVTNAIAYFGYAAAILLGTWLGSRLLQRLSARTLYRAAIAALVLTFVAAAGLGNPRSLVEMGLLGALMGLLCGIAAPLALTLSLERGGNDRGAASAMQGAIKMAGAGLFLGAFDLVDIVDFGALVRVNLVLASVLGALSLWFERRVTVAAGPRSGTLRSPSRRQTDD